MLITGSWRYWKSEWTDNEWTDWNSNQKLHSKGKPRMNCLHCLHCWILTNISRNSITRRHARFQDGGGWGVDPEAELKALKKWKRPEIAPSPLLAVLGAQQKCFSWFLKKWMSKPYKLSPWKGDLHYPPRVETFMNPIDQAQKEARKGELKNSKKKSAWCFQLQF